jgi:glutamine synthetase
MDIEQVRAVCEERGIHTVECAFPDPHGIPRGKRIPVRHFLEGGHRGFDIANVALAWDRKCEVLPEMRYANFETGYPDMRAVPDLSTFRPIPWREGAASVLCDCVEEDGSTSAVSTRAILKDVVAEARSMGYEPMVGSELEFYIFDLEGRPLYPEIDCYSLVRGATLEGFLGRVRRELDEFGVQIEACNTEYGPAQVEVNIRYADALTTADRTMLFKAAVKEIAAQEGLRVSFMAKPFADQSGSGYHVHQSLRDLDTGENAFAPAGHGFHGAPPAMRSYLAGLLAHVASFTALGSPTVNAYKRVQGYTFAPVNVGWGIDNRTVAVRAIVGHGAANRLEWRNGAADANPYVLIAACIAAGLDGIRQSLEPPPAVEGDAYAREDLPRLPDTLEAALDALRADDLAQKVFGEFLDVFLTLGRHEVALWRAAVTDWERERYLDG